MLTSQYTKPLTGEMLWDIIRSQRTLFGDMQLTTVPELEVSVELFIGDVNIMDCMDPDSMIEDCHKLNYLDARLKNLPESFLQSHVSTNSVIDAPFKVGFYSEEDGFIEVISHDEILQG